MESSSTKDEETIAVSIVIPCYRDEAGLEPLLARLEPVMSGIPGGAELVLVDDGSPDRTGERAIELAASFPHPVTVVRLARNFGQHPAVFAGLAHARGAAVVTMDSDLQYSPEEVPQLLAELSPQSPVVSGYRADRHDPLPRRLITRVLTRWINRRTNSNLTDFGSMFRAYHRRVVEQMLQMTERHRHVPAVVAWLGVPVKEIPVSHSGRSEAGTRYHLGALIDMAFDLITGYSVSPLRVVTVFGLLACGIGFLATLAFAVYRVFEGSGGAGTVSAFALLFFLVGVNLLIVALVAEYVGRIYTEAKARPYYVVGEVVTNNPQRHPAPELSGRL